MDFEAFGQHATNHQKELLKTSGLPFEREQLRREAEGQPRRLKPLIALQMEISGPSLKRYGTLMVDAVQWDHLPPECKIHSLAMSGFRCAAKSAASLYRAEVVKNRTYPFLSFGPAAATQAVAHDYAQTIVRDRENQPCIMDPWSFEISGEMPTVALQMSPVPRAKLNLIGKHSDLENSQTEADNAQDRRNIKQRLQQPQPHLTDVCAQHVARFSRAARATEFGDETDDSSSSSEEAVHRGGGTYRAYISAHKDELKGADGKVDFKMAKASWDSRDMDTQEHKEIVETGKAATAAGRLKAGASSAMVDVSSNFGRVKNEHTRSADRSEKRNTLLQFIDEAVGSANSVVRDHDLQLEVVHRNPMSMVLSHVAKAAGGGLDAQLQEMDRVCRAVAWRMNSRKREAKQKVKEFIEQSSSSSLNLLSSTILSLPLLQFSSLKRVATPVPRFQFVDRLHSYAEALLESLLESRKPSAVAAKQAFADGFHKFVKMKPTDSVPDLPPVSASFRPTYCHKYGAGRCICSGIGIAHDCFRRALCGMLFLMCPPCTKSRRWMLDGWLCARISHNYYHVSDVMLNPAKVTLIKLNFLEDFPDGSVLLEMVLDDHGEPPAYMDVELGRLIAEQPASIALFKLRALDSPHFPFTLAGRLSFDPLNHFCDMVTNDFSFWAGAEPELRKEADRRRKKAVAAAKKRAGQARGGGAGAARERPVARAWQRPPGAGLLIQLEDAPAPLAGDAGRGPVQLHVLADLDDDDGHGAELHIADDALQVDECPGGDGFVGDWNLQVAIDEAGEDEGGNTADARANIDEPAVAKRITTHVRNRRRAPTYEIEG